MFEMEIKHFKGIKKSDNIDNFELIINNTLDYENIHYILEYDLSNATEKMRLYGFYVFTDKLDPTKLIIDKFNKITKINFDQYIIYDIDLDGSEEFITKLGYGYGTYIITLSVWKYNEEEKRLELSHKTQYEQLENIDMFIKETNGKIEIVAGIWDEGVLLNEQSYGELLIQNGILKPEKQDIPFRLLG